MPENTTSLELDGLTITTFMGHDGTPVVQIDTDGHNGRLRVNVNDAPVFDQDPEDPPRVPYENLER